MENETNRVDQKPVSVLKDDGFCASRILARETSVGESSRIFYRDSDGVPFQWEMRPGTPKHPQQEDPIPPPSPSPLMQSLGLPLPNIEHEDDEDKGSLSKLSKHCPFKKIVRKSMNSDIVKKVEKLSMIRRYSKQQESSRFGDSDGEFVASVKDSSFSSNSSSLSFSPNHGVMEWNFSAILNEGNTRIYYCRQHKTAFTLEEDGIFSSKILSRVSTTKQFSGPFQYGITDAGVPFHWEMQPGTPKNPPENDHIPPPSPPPSVQSSALPLPRVHVGGEEAEKSTWQRVRFWIKRKYQIKQSGKKHSELSFRQHKKKDIFCSEEGLDVSFRKSDSSSSLCTVAPPSKGRWRMSKMKKSLKGSYFSWSSRKVLVLARRKLKSLTF